MCIFSSAPLAIAERKHFDETCIRSATLGNLWNSYPAVARIMGWWWRWYLKFVRPGECFFCHYICRWSIKWSQRLLWCGTNSKKYESSSTHYNVCPLFFQDIWNAYHKDNISWCYVYHPIFHQPRGGRRRGGVARFVMTRGNGERCFSQVLREFQCALSFLLSC